MHLKSSVDKYISHRDGSELQSLLQQEEAELCGCRLRGPKPKMAYKEKFLAAIGNCISERYSDLESEPVVQSSRIASLRQWPPEMPGGNFSV